jgi:polysaccharide export outer membrane protein
MGLITTGVRRCAAFLGITTFLAFSPGAGFAQNTPALPVTVAPGGEDGTVQTSKAYRIRQGDLVTIMIFGEPTLSVNPIRVVQGGTVALALIGDVPIGGQTTTGAANLIANRYKKYLRDPQVTVAIYSVGPVEALVLGNVRTPGKYTLPPPAKLTDILAAAGGLGPTDGDLPEARIETADGVTTSVPLQKLLHDGDTKLDMSIDSGVTVYIPAPTVFNVTVQGAVDKPGDVAMHEGDDVAVAVARAGASTNSNPDLNHVIVKRTALDGTVTAIPVNLYPIIKNGDMSHDVKLQKGDLVFVPQASKHGNLLDFLYPLSAVIPH